MSKPSPTPAGGPAVSKARTIVSLVLLLVVGVICVIELRAGLGHWMTANAMKAKCNEQGEFENLTLQDAQGLVKFGPAVKENSQDADVSFRYTWFSLLRPVMGDASPGLTLVATKGDKPMALAFHTDAEEEAAAPGTGAPPSTSSPGRPAGMNGGPGGGMMGGMMGGPGGPGGGPGGGRPERPPMEDEGSDTAASKEGSATDKPAEEKPTEEKPAEEKPADQPSSDTPKGEKPAEEKPADNAAETPAEPK